MHFFLFLFSCVFGSSGDRTHWHQNCLKKCFREHCRSEQIYFPIYSFPFSSVPCPLKCKYDCIVEANTEIGKYWKNKHQFYGKWSFKHAYNCEEIASVIFSLGNGLFTIIGYSRSTSKKHNFTSKNAAYFSKLLKIHAILCSIVWLCSAQFHARDTLISERMDYFGAAAMIYYTLLISLSRNFQNLKNLFIYLLSTLYLFHVGIMTHRFDYGLNMKICVFIGLSSVLLWVRLYLVERRDHLFKLAALSIFSSALLALEILDFPPIWGYFDAHSLWHAATMPLPLFFYYFLHEDVAYLEYLEMLRRR